MGCPPVRRDNARALASGLSYVQVNKHGITILYHLHAEHFTLYTFKPNGITLSDQLIQSISVLRGVG